MVICGAVYAGRLNNLYLPASVRQNLVNAAVYSTPSNQYIPSSPSSRYSVPSRQYLAPVQTDIISAKKINVEHITTSPPSKQYLVPNNQYTRINPVHQVPTSNRQYVPPTNQHVISNQHYTPVSQYSPFLNQYETSATYNDVQKNQYITSTTPIVNSQSSYNQVPIVRASSNPNVGDGGYQYAYETGNGISAEEQGTYGTAKGSFAFTSPEGEQVSLEYTADENGFHPRGSHLPTPPPIPEEIRRSVEQNLAEEARGGHQEGSYTEGTYDSVAVEAARQTNGYKY